MPRTDRVFLDCYPGGVVARRESFVAGFIFIGHMHFGTAMAAIDNGLGMLLSGLSIAHGAHIHDGERVCWTHPSMQLCGVWY